MMNYCLITPCIKIDNWHSQFGILIILLLFFFKLKLAEDCSISGIFFKL